MYPVPKPALQPTGKVEIPQKNFSTGIRTRNFDKARFLVFLFFKLSFNIYATFKS